MATEGFIQGNSGEEISLLVDGIKVMALQNLKFKASQKKAPIRGAGYRKPHAMGRGPKEYELDFEVNRRAESEIHNLARKLNLIGEKIEDVEELLRERRRESDGGGAVPPSF